jgi:hypothetical protein
MSTNSEQKYIFDIKIKQLSKQKHLSKKLIPIKSRNNY